MRIQLLRTFLTVARCRSYAVAAQELLYSESSVSYHIRELEKSLGVSLVARVDGCLQLTPAGRSIVHAAGELLMRADEITAVVSRMKAPRGAVAPFPHARSGAA